MESATPTSELLVALNVILNTLSVIALAYIGKCIDGHNKKSK